MYPLVLVLYIISPSIICEMELIKINSLCTDLQDWPFCKQTNRKESFDFNKLFSSFSGATRQSNSPVTPTIQNSRRWKSASRLILRPPPEKLVNNSNRAAIGGIPETCRTFPELPEVPGNSRIRRLPVPASNSRLLRRVTVADRFQTLEAILGHKVKENRVYCQCLIWKSTSNLVFRRWVRISKGSATATRSFGEKVVADRNVGRFRFFNISCSQGSSVTATAFKRAPSHTKSSHGRLFFQGRNPLSVSVIAHRVCLQVFNGCPLKIHCTASWIHPDTHDQHILVGAEEGIYTLNLTELHENAMDLLYPRRTVWMFVIKDVLMTLSGKTPSLFRHDLLGLHSKQSDRLTISMNAMHKIPSKFVPKKFAMTSKVRNPIRLIPILFNDRDVTCAIQTVLCVEYQLWLQFRLQTLRAAQSAAWAEIHTTGTSICAGPPLAASSSCSGTTPSTSSCCWSTSNARLQIRRGCSRW